MRRNQVLGDLLVLRDERRLGIEHDHPAELSFECHKIEEQFVLLESKVVHRNTPSCIPEANVLRPVVSRDHRSSTTIARGCGLDGSDGDRGESDAHGGRTYAGLRTASKARAHAREVE